MNPSSPLHSSIFDEFLQELQVINDFRSEYARRYEFEGLGREDPDVERLIEAMAFYRARTRSAVDRGIREHQLRALEQLFPYLLSPMPAMAILYPQLSSNMTEPRVLPEYAEISVNYPKPSAIDEGPRVFRTTRALTVFPLHIVERSVRLVRQRAAGQVVEGESGAPPSAPWVLQLEVAPSPNGRDTKRYYDDPARRLQEMRFYVNPTGDTFTALRLHDALQRNCCGVVVRAFAEGSERFRTGPIRVCFGSNPGEDETASDNPIESTRRAIHFPLAQLCFVVPLQGLPSEWNRLTFEFLLGEGWPEGLQAADTSLVLGGVPIENLVTRTAEPILIDGTMLRNVVESAERPHFWKVREIRGVYTTDPNAPGVRRTLLPNSLLDEGYTAIARGCGTERELFIETDPVLGVVEAEATLYVDADWYNPEPTFPQPRSAIVRADAHDLGPLCWKLLEPLRVPCDSPVLSEPLLLEHLLELQGQSPSSARELKMLLKVLGVEQSELFSRIPRYVERLESKLVPDLQSPMGAIRAYDVGLSRVPPVLMPAARLLFSFMPRFLATWTGEPDVKVSVTIDGTAAARPWMFEWRTLTDV